MASDFDQQAAELTVSRRAFLQGAGGLEPGIEVDGGNHRLQDLL